jgi:glycerophosphoryl diester phosphodiesterase
MNNKINRFKRIEVRYLTGYVIFFMILLVVISCSNHTPSSTFELPFRYEHRPIIVAHRGGSLEAPENTIAAIKHSIDIGSDWQEIDVQLSKDLKVIVMHDVTIDRTTNGTGHVREMLANDIYRFKAGQPSLAEKVRARLKELNIVEPEFADRFIQEKVPSLEQVLQIKDSRIMIEIRTDPRAELVVAKVIDVIKKSEAHQRVAIASFDQKILKQVVVQDSSIPIIGIAKSEEAIEEILNLPISALAVKDSLVKFSLKRVKDEIAIWGYTVYAPDQMNNLIKQGVHGIVTDVPSQVVKLLKSQID